MSNLPPEQFGAPQGWPQPPAPQPGWPSQYGTPQTPQGWPQQTAPLPGQPVFGFSAPGTQMDLNNDKSINQIVFWVIAFAVGMIVMAVVAVMAVLSTTGSDSTSRFEAVGREINAASDDTDPLRSAPTTAPVVYPSPLVTSTEKFDIEVLSVSDPDPTNRAPLGTRSLSYFINVTNTSSEVQNFNAMDHFTLQGVQGNLYGATFPTTTSSDPIAPGWSIFVTVYFNVLETDSPSQLTFYSITPSESVEIALP